jgi:3-dehydroquinate synthase
LAEVVKYGVILDAPLFSWLEAHAAEVLTRDPAALAHVVSRCVDIKARVVEEDEHERTGLRAVLNYGHTVGHALEALAGYGALLHGEAVAIGMAAAARLAAGTGRWTVDEVQRQNSLLARFGLPLTAPPGLEEPVVERALAVMARDKKSLHGRVRFILPTAIGRVELTDDVDSSLLEAVLRDVLLSVA